MKTVENTLARTLAASIVQKTRDELRSLEAVGVHTAGNAFSPVLFVKGETGDAEREGREPLSGADGTALRAALIKLGYAPQDWAAVYAGPDAGPDARSSADSGVAPAASGEPPATGWSGELLRLAVAVFDPSTLVLLDDTAAAAARDAYADELVAIPDLQGALLSAGWVVRVNGMRMLNLGGFEAALANPREKQRMWAYLKQVPPLGEPY